MNWTWNTWFWQQSWGTNHTHCDLAQVRDWINKSRVLAPQMRIWTNIMGLYQQTLRYKHQWTTYLVPIGPTNFKAYQVGAGINMGLSEKRLINPVVNHHFHQSTIFGWYTPKFSDRPRMFSNQSAKHHWILRVCPMDFRAPSPTDFQTNLCSKQRWLPLPKKGAARLPVHPARDNVHQGWPLLEVISQSFSGLEPIIHVYCMCINVYIYMCICMYHC